MQYLHRIRLHILRKCTKISTTHLWSVFKYLEASASFLIPQTLRTRLNRQRHEMQSTCVLTYQYQQPWDSDNVIQPVIQENYLFLTAWQNPEVISCTRGHGRKGVVHHPAFELWSILKYKPAIWTSRTIRYWKSVTVCNRYCRKQADKMNIVRNKYFKNVLALRQKSTGKLTHNLKRLAKTQTPVWRHLSWLTYTLILPLVSFYWVEAK